MTAERYRRISAWFAERPRAYRTLVRLNTGLPLLFYYLYPLLPLGLAARQDSRFWRVLAVPAAAFAVCTLMRYAVHARRPYETEGFEPLIRRGKTGDSFPSRHMTCAAVIASAYGFLWPPAGAALGAAAVGIAVIRVLAGIHYPRDVFAGGALGLLGGVVGFWLL